MRAKRRDPEPVCPGQSHGSHGSSVDLDDTLADDWSMYSTLCTQSKSPFTSATYCSSSEVIAERSGKGDKLRVCESGTCLEALQVRRTEYRSRIHFSRACDSLEKLGP
jgi:hypothetical protein